MSEAWLFVYGTLRPDHGGMVARRLEREATLVGPASVDGLLYRIADYPGLVPGGNAEVAGDLYRLSDPVPTLAWLDDYEECSLAFPQPWEFRRALIPVVTRQGVVDAWTYLYARNVATFERIEGGDFLA